MAVFWSCAIHKDFPYICFLPGCVAKQFGLPDLREVRAKQKSRKKARQTKRKRNRIKSENRKDNYAHDDESYEPVKRKDSLRYTLHPENEGQYVIIKFEKKGVQQKDSILIKYPDKEDGFREYDLQLLKNYVDSNGVEKIDVIEVKEHTGSKGSDDYYEKHLSALKKKLKEFFMHLGIPPENIRLKNK